jgi:3-oxoacyl-[acyl-carrier protein] reductase
MRRFEGCHVIVTGASRGLGRAIAEAFASEGARVGIGYRTRVREAQETLAIVERVRGMGVLLPFDVRDPASIDKAFASFVSNGQIDALVNSAAAVHDQLVSLLAPEQWEEVIATNLTGTFNCCRAALRYMMPKRRGAIVNVASVAGIRASPGQANYAASKGGVVALTATVGAECASRGVRVNAVVPGLLTTGMGQRLDHRILEQRRAAVPLARFGDAREVASAVLFLASDDASYIVGQSLVVDGGLSL